MSAARAAGAMRPLEAFHAVSRFAARLGDAAFRLAMHAAVPQSFRPDLLHLLRLNFVPEAADAGAAEADVLLAPFSAELGGGYFQFDPEVRRLLLDYLRETYAGEPVSRVVRVADFLLAYVEHAERGATAGLDRLAHDFLHTQRWVGLAFARPDEAAEQLAGALHDAEHDTAVGVRLHLGGVAHAVAIPLAHRRDLLQYARALEALESGDRETAVQILEPLSRRDIKVGGITLHPASVLQRQRRGAGAGTAAADDARTEPRLRRVFISATHDLEAYRRAATGVCRELGLEPLTTANLTATADSVLTRLKGLLETADVFVSIQGPSWYGSILPGDTRSATEIEFDAAVELGIAVLAFSVTTPVSGLTPDEDDRAAAFRTKLQSHQSLSARSHSDLGRLRQRLAGAFETLEQQILAGESPDGGWMQPPEATGKLFLAYNESQREFALRLADDLSATGLGVQLESKEAFDAELADDYGTLLLAPALLLVLDEPILAPGVAGVEWSILGEIEKPVVLILRPGMPDELPPELAGMKAVDFSEDSSYTAAFDALVHALASALTASGELGPLSGVPALPASWIVREEEERLRRALVVDSAEIIVLSGEKGAGKTTLATAAAHNPAVRRHFSRGVHWFSAGEYTEPADLRRAVLHSVDALQYQGESPDAVPASGAFLVILDNVVDLAMLAAVPLKRGPGRLLAVVENASHGSMPLRAEIVEVGGLTRDAALLLLALELGVPVHELPDDARTAVERLGMLPLMLQAAAAAVRDGAAWGELDLEALAVHSRSQLAALYHRRGFMAMEEGRPSEAEGWYRRSLTVSEELDDRANAALRCAELGAVARLTGSLSSARDWYQRSLALSLEQGDRSAIAARYADLGETAREEGALEQADHWFRISLGLSHDLGDRRAMAVGYSKLGRVEQLNGRLDGAERLHRDALALHAMLGNRAGVAKAYEDIGRVARDRGELELAEESFRKSLAESEEIGDELEMAARYADMGWIAWRSRRWSQAEAWFARSLAVYEKLGDRGRVAACHMEIAGLARETNDMVRAEDSLRRARAVMEELGDTAGMAAALRELGRLEHARANLREAADFFEHALAIAGLPGTDDGARLGGRQVGLLARVGRDVAKSYHDLAQTAKAQGQYPLAEHWYRRSLGLSEALGDPQEAEVCYRSLQELARGKRERTAAEEWRNQSRVSIEAADAAERYRQIATAAHREAQLSEADTWYRRLLTLSKESGVRGSVALCYADLGELARRRGRLSKAESLLLQALNIYQAKDYQDGLQATYYDLGTIAYQRGNLHAAAEWRRKALALDPGSGG